MFRPIALLLCSFLGVQAATPVERHGAIKVSGASLVGEDGQRVQLAGPSLYWSVWGGQNYYNKDVVAWVAKDWKATLIRASMAVDINQTRDKGYLLTPEPQMALVKTVVDAAIANGIYVVVDWHDHDGNLHIPQAKVFFEAMAKAYGNTPNVIWEIWNEPDGKNGTGSGGADSWPDIRKYADSIVPVIRAHSKNLIVVGTPNWSQDVHTAAMTPVPDSNIAYSLHFYAGTHGASLRSKGLTALRRNKALFISEFGATTSDGGQHPTTTNPTDNFKIYPESTKVWLDWADSCGLSWANWSLSNKDEASAALLATTTTTTGGWSVEQLSPSGKFIRARLLQMDSIAAARPATVRRLASGASLRIVPTASGIAFHPPAGARRVFVRDLSGRSLAQTRLDGARVEIPLPRGVAIVSIETAYGTFSRHITRM